MLTELFKYVVGLKESGPVDEVDDGSLQLVPDSCKLEDIERYLPGRRRFRAMFRAHDIPAFIEYVKANINNADTPVIVIDPESLSAMCVWDWQEQGHCENRAAVKAPASPEFRLYRQLVDRHATGSNRSTQRQAVEFVEDWAHCLSEPQRLLTALRTLDVKAKRDQSSSVSNLSESRSVMESVELDSLDMPEIVQLSFEPSNGLSAVSADLRVVMSFEDSVPRLAFVPVRPDVVMEEIAVDFRDHLEVTFADDGVDALVHIGTLEI